jgi:hypothetical protein
MYTCVEFGLSSWQNTDRGCLRRISRGEYFDIRKEEFSNFYYVFMLRKRNTIKPTQRLRGQSPDWAASSWPATSSKDKFYALKQHKNGRKEENMGTQKDTWAYIQHAWRKQYILTKFWLENFVRTMLDGVGVYWRIILKCIFKKEVMKE